MGMRRVVHTTLGHKHGPITRLVSPGDFGEHLKPFVFLDLFDARNSPPANFGRHPHSGISTVTYLAEGQAYFRSSKNEIIHLPKGSVEYMSASGGVWHAGSTAGKTVPPDQRPVGFQLWLAQPESTELNPSFEVFLDSSKVPKVSEAETLILGSYKGVSSPLEIPWDLTYLAVRLPPDTAYTFTPSSTHEVAFLASFWGELSASGEPLDQGELAIFEEGNEEIVVRSGKAGVNFIIGSAVKHIHPLVTGMYSVHTSREALRKGEANIRRIKVEEDLTTDSGGEL